MSAFDEIIHAPHRLQICAMLVQAGALEFGPIRDHLEVSDSLLSKQLKVLADAGYAKLEKVSPAKGRQRTVVSLTRAGRRAYDGHLAALRELVAQAQLAAPQDASTAGA